MTYPDVTVANYIGKNFIPLQINVLSGSQIINEYRVVWTPTIVIVDTKGTEYYRFVGFLPPEEFIPQLQFGLAMMAIHKQEYKTASLQLSQVIYTYPKSSVAPEALYWLGVSDYKSSHDVNALLRSWKKLKSEYSHSTWAQRVSFIGE